MSARILVVAGDSRKRGLLRSLFPPPRFLTRCESDAGAALACARSWRPQIVLLDLACESAPWRGLLAPLAAVPVLPFLIFPRGQRAEMLAAMETGAVSALEEPFAPEEIVGRVNALLRHAAVFLGGAAVLAWGELSVDLPGRRAAVAGRPLALTPKELDILGLLVESAGRVLARRHILESVWGYDSELDVRNVDFRMSTLRRKLGPRVAAAFETVPGVGYCFRPSALRAE